MSDIHEVPEPPALDETREQTVRRSAREWLRVCRETVKKASKP